MRTREGREVGKRGKEYKTDPNKTERNRTEQKGTGTEQKQYRNRT